ncbi:MAG: hypothetical protein ABWZ29_00090 [Casimicrobiaceae bacterium]
MFGFLTPARREVTGPLANVATADNFWRSLPRNDPLAAQKAMCEALSDLAARKDLNRELLRALLALDQRSRSLRDALLVNYASRNPQAKPFERRYWRAAIELSQSFALTFARFLTHMRNEPSARGWREYAPAVVLRLFRHRQVEFLLRPFLSEAATPQVWTELHSAYQFADAQGWSHHPIPAASNPDPAGIETTLQKEYVHILLLELMNGGQFSPYDAFWLSRWIPHWYQVTSLVEQPGGVGPDGHHFVVDLDSAEGLKRVSPGALGHALYLDASPLLEAIDAEIEALRDPAGGVRIASTFGRARQVKLLRKLAANHTPRPPRVNRRGERKHTASTVKAVIGLGHIVRMLRHEEKKKHAAVPQAVPEVEEITITVDGGYTKSSAEVDTRDGPRTNTPGLEFGVPHQFWQLKDRSASGCRLRAPVADAPKVSPGTLVAIRDEETMRWSLVVVRRLKTRIGDRIDIGVEYVGQNPRGVTMAVEGAHSPRSAASATDKGGLFTAVYLRESAKQPAMPFKTLIMASTATEGIACLTLRSATAEYTVRLKEPIEEQDDFVWLPYEVLERRAADRPAEDGTSTPWIETRPPPVTQDPAPPTDWLIPQLGKRARTAA